MAFSLFSLGGERELCGISSSSYKDTPPPTGLELHAYDIHVTKYSQIGVNASAYTFWENRIQSITSWYIFCVSVRPVILRVLYLNWDNF